MKVLHVGCPYTPYSGGSTVRLRSLVTRYCNADKVKGYLATPISRSHLTDDYPFVEVYRDQKVNSLRFSRPLFKFVRRVNPDAVVIHNSRALIKWIVWYRLFFNVKIIVEIHSFREESPLRTLLNKLLYKFVHGFVVLSKASAQELERRYSIINAKVVYNGVEIKKAQILGGGQRLVTFGYLGSFHEWQGVFYIAHAARILGAEFWENHRLVLAGGGPAYQACLDILGDLIHHQNIVVKSWVSSEEAENILGELDYLLAPRPSNLATETVVPLKVVESIAYKIPLIISNVGGLTELLDKKSAIVMSEISADSLAQAMRLASLKPDYEAMKAELDSKYHNASTWNDSADSYVEYLTCICMNS